MEKIRLLKFIVLMLISSMAYGQNQEYKVIPTSVKYVDKVLANGKYKGTVNSSSLPHGFGEIYFKSGARRYFGQWVNGKIEGLGAKEFDPDNFYVGEFKGAALSGIGYMEWASGSKYFGQWSNNLQNGIGFSSSYSQSDFGYWSAGKLTAPIKDYAIKIFNDNKSKTNLSQGIKEVTNLQTNFGTYTGGWKNGAMNGYGLLDTGSEIIIAEWDSSSYNKGTVYFANYDNGFWMEHTYKNGIKEGKYLYISWDFYVSAVISNDSIAKGFKIIRDPGEKYIGVFLIKNGFPEYGWGSLIWPRGMYEGNFKDGFYNGQGKMINDDGEIHEGTWENTLVTGKTIYPSGSPQTIYEGQYSDGLPDGIGVMHYSDGKIYEGGWAKGKMNGKGKLMFSDGEIIQHGIWKDDVYISQ